MKQPAQAKHIAQMVIIEFGMDGTLWNVTAKWSGRKIGYIYCMRTGDRLLLSEFWVEDELQVPWPVCDGLRLLLGIPRRKMNFRNQGVGRRLLERLLAEAKRAGVKEIWGSVTQEDIGKTPGLLEWYARHGFAVGDTDAECIQNAAKKITLKLGNA